MVSLVSHVVGFCPLAVLPGNQYIQDSFNCIFYAII